MDASSGNAHNCTWAHCMPQTPVHSSALTLNTVHQFTSTKLCIRQPQRWKRCRNEAPNQCIPTMPQSRRRLEAAGWLAPDSLLPSSLRRAQALVPISPHTLAGQARGHHSGSTSQAPADTGQGSQQGTVPRTSWPQAHHHVHPPLGQCQLFCSFWPMWMAVRSPSPQSQACSRCSRVAKAQRSCPWEGDAHSRDLWACAGHVCWARASTARVCLAQMLPSPSLVCQKDRGAGAGNVSSCQGMSCPPPVSRRHKETSSSLRQTGFVLSSCKHRRFYLKQKTQDVTDERRNADRPAACRAPQTGECFSGSQRVSRQD